MVSDHTPASAVQAGTGTERRFRLSDRLRVAIDELRVQMIGTEVLFGFQLQGAFREGFRELSRRAQVIDVVAISAIVLALAAMIGAPAQHRLVERGNASLRLLRVTGALGSTALLLLAVALGCDAYLAAEPHLGRGLASTFGVSVLLVAFGFWFFFAYRDHASRPGDLPAYEETLAHEKIEQMLHEAWIALPGATGICGFQLQITALASFHELLPVTQRLHFCATALVMLAVVLLLTPAAVHRRRFHGGDSPESHRIGSRLLVAALVPLSIGIAIDYYVATGRMLGSHSAPLLLSIVCWLVLAGTWLVWPTTVRYRSAAGRRNRE